jgi:hypothetical protein
MRPLRRSAACLILACAAATAAHGQQVLTDRATPPVKTRDDKTRLERAASEPIRSRSPSQAHRINLNGPTWAGTSRAQVNYTPFPLSVINVERPGVLRTSDLAGLLRPMGELIRW